MSYKDTFRQNLVSEGGEGERVVVFTNSQEHDVLKRVSVSYDKLLFRQRYRISYHEIRHVATLSLACPKYKTEGPRLHTEVPCDVCRVRHVLQLLLTMVKHYPNSKVITDSRKRNQGASPLVILQRFGGSTGRHPSE
jgi:hypothetical protein